MASPGEGWGPGGGAPRTGGASWGGLTPAWQPPQPQAGAQHHPGASSSPLLFATSYMHAGTPPSAASGAPPTPGDLLHMQQQQPAAVRSRGVAAAPAAGYGAQGMPPVMPMLQLVPLGAGSDGAAGMGGQLYSLQGGLDGSDGLAAAYAALCAVVSGQPLPLPQQQQPQQQPNQRQQQQQQQAGGQGPTNGHSSVLSPVPRSFFSPLLSPLSMLSPLPLARTGAAGFLSPLGGTTASLLSPPPPPLTATGCLAVGSPTAGLCSPLAALGSPLAGLGSPNPFAGLFGRSRGSAEDLAGMQGQGHLQSSYLSPFQPYEPASGNVGCGSGAGGDGPAAANGAAAAAADAAAAAAGAAALMAAARATVPEQEQEPSLADLLGAAPEARMACSPTAVVQPAAHPVGLQLETAASSKHRVRPKQGPAVQQRQQQQQQLQKQARPKQAAVKKEARTKQQQLPAAAQVVAQPQAKQQRVTAVKAASRPQAKQQPHTPEVPAAAPSAASSRKASSSRKSSSGAKRSADSGGDASEGTKRKRVSGNTPSAATSTPAAGASSAPPARPKATARPRPPRPPRERPAPPPLPPVAPGVLAAGAGLRATLNLNRVGSSLEAAQPTHVTFQLPTVSFGDVEGTCPVRCRFLFQKTLSASDAGKVGRIVLPRCASSYLPEVEGLEGVEMDLQDPRGGIYVWRLKLWQSGIFLFEGCRGFQEAWKDQIAPKSTLAFYEMPSGALLVDPHPLQCHFAAEAPAPGPAAAAAAAGAPQDQQAAPTAAAPRRAQQAQQAGPAAAAAAMELEEEEEEEEALSEDEA